MRHDYIIAFEILGVKKRIQSAINLNALRHSA